MRTAIQIRAFLGFDAVPILTDPSLILQSPQGFADGNQGPEGALICVDGVLPIDWHRLRELLPDVRSRAPIAYVRARTYFNVQNCGNARVFNDHDPTPCSVCAPIVLVG